MQQAILEAVLNGHGLRSEQENIQFLENLQSSGVELWNAFRAFPVVVDYRRRDIQSVYMLRYFPSYSQIIKLILQSVHRHPGHLPFGSSNLEVSFFGCGPSPEIYGFFEFLTGTSFRPQQLRINTFDIFSDDWAFARNITFNNLIPSIWNPGLINSHNHNLNIALNNSFLAHIDVLQRSKLVVFQNCLNEIPDNLHAVVRNNLRILVDNLPPGGLVLIIDLLGYQPVLDFLNNIENDSTIRRSVQIIRSSTNGEQSYDAKNLVNTMPDIIRNHFLTGIPVERPNGLIPRRYIRFHYMLLRKN